MGEPPKLPLGISPIRLGPVLPWSPGRIERHGFEYYRHGTLSLFAALNTQTGEVVGQTVPRHTSAAFVAFLEALLAEGSGFLGPLRECGDRFVGPLRKGACGRCEHPVREFSRALPLERSVMMLIVVPPKRIAPLLSVLQRREPVHAQAIFAESAIEGFDPGVVRRLAPATEVESDPVLVRPGPS